MVVKSAIEQIHADYTERFLLFDVGFIKQPHVDDNLARWAAFLGLKSHAEPSVRFIVLFKTARCHGVRDRKSTRLNSSHRTISYAVFCLKKKKQSTLSHTPSRKLPIRRR